ncbi:MAG: choice-of-anchor E domain-containing protein [Verrucomicrobia bacterium]|jgi:hypothetical protein|nr:choice-of-anchor E domain-containing protein [Verrucomicrobiota bacterium]MBT7066696.1 choice-of-anchor E domain-containing protein [Verrucomicrobiota bacterium]
MGILLSRSKMGLLAAVALVVIICGMATSASALTISYTNVVDNGGSDYTAGDAGSFDLSQFDSSLGNLTAVVLEITANAIGGHNRLDNESETDAGTVDLELGADITVTGPASLLVLTLPHESTSGSVTVDTDAGGPTSSARISSALPLQMQRMFKMTLPTASPAISVRETSPSTLPVPATSA